MKRTIKVGGSFEGVVSTGPYENSRPGFFVEETFEDDFSMKDSDIFERQMVLQEKAYENFKRAEQKAFLERIEKERKDFRFRKLPNGELVPSVTTFLNYDADFFQPQNLLIEYAAQGTLMDLIATHYFANGEWITDLKKLIEKYPENWVDYVIVHKGSLGFEPEKWNLPAFLAKFPIKARGWKLEVHNEKDRYAGELDLYGDYEDELTIMDYKRTPDKVKNFCQMSCYAVAARNIGLEFKKMMIIPCYPDNQQGYSKPIISNEIDKYYKISMRKREDFKKRYGI